MGFFKNVGKALGKAGKAVGGVVAKVGHTAASVVPGVSTIYGLATNVFGKDLNDLGNAITNKKTPSSEGANALAIHNALQLENGKISAFDNNVINNNLASFNSVPVVNGMYITSDNYERSFDTNPLMNPTVVNSGATNTALVNAFASQGINPATVQEALTGQQPRGKVNLESILDLISGVSNTVKDTVLKPVAPVQSNDNKNFLLFAGGLGALGLGYILLNK